MQITKDQIFKRVWTPIAPKDGALYHPESRGGTQFNISLFGRNQVKKTAPIDAGLIKSINNAQRIFNLCIDFTWIETDDGINVFQDLAVNLITILNSEDIGMEIKVILLREFFENIRQQLLAGFLNVDPKLSNFGLSHRGKIGLIDIGMIESLEDLSEGPELDSDNNDYTFFYMKFISERSKLSGELQELFDLLSEEYKFNSPQSLLAQVAKRLES